MSIVKPSYGALVNSKLSISSGFLLSWLLNEGSGTTANDSSGNGLNGTFQGSPLPSWTTGQYGDAVSFPAVANTSVINATGWTSKSTPLSFAFSVCPTSLSASTRVYLRLHGAGAPQVYLDSGSPTIPDLYDGGFLPGSPAMTPGSQYIIAGIIKGTGQNSLWVNGNKVSGAASAITSTICALGNNPTDTKCATAKFDFLYMWNRALLDSEVVLLNTDPFAPYRSTSNLSLYFKLI